MSIKASTTYSDRRFRVLIEHSTEAIALLTPEGTVTYASPSIERVLGYTPQEFMAINGFAVIQDRKSNTSELQSHSDLVCRLLLEKKKRTYASQTRVGLLAFAVCAILCVWR